MLEEIEGQELETTSDATEETSSESPSSDGQSSEVAAKADASGNNNQEATNLPFHEHPRFKELVEQKNQALQAQKSLEERYAQMEAQLKQFSQTNKPQPVKADTDDLIEDLKKVDPRLAARFEQFAKTAQMTESLSQKLLQQEQAQVRNQAIAQVNTLHEANKVTPELKSFIENELDRMAIQGQIKDLAQIPTAYKAVHDAYTKFIDGIKRDTLKSYVPSKTADAKTPTSQPKGKPVSNTSKPQAFSKDPEQARAQIVSRYLKQAKAEADI